MSSKENNNSLDLNNIKDNSSVKFCDKVKNNFLKSRQNNCLTSKDITSSSSFISYSEDENGSAYLVSKRSIKTPSGIEEIATVIDPPVTDFDFVNEDDIIRAFADEYNYKNVLMYLSDYFSVDDITNFMMGSASYDLTKKIIDAFDTTKDEYEAICKKCYATCSFIPLNDLFDFNTYIEL